MTQKDPNVKQYPRRLRPLFDWIDAHPRTGWYIVLIMSANFALNLLDAMDVDPFWFVR